MPDAMRAGEQGPCDSPHLMGGHTPQAATALKKHGTVTDAGVTTL